VILIIVMIYLMIIELQIVSLRVLYHYAILCRSNYDYGDKRESNVRWNRTRKEETSGKNELREFSSRSRRGTNYLNSQLNAPLRRERKKFRMRVFAPPTWLVFFRARARARNEISFLLCV